LELVKLLHNKKVAFDTSIFIYFIEENPKYYSALKKLFKNIEKGKTEIVTSTLTLLELLVKPIKFSKHNLVNEYKNILLNSDRITLFDLDHNISELSAGIRARYGTRTPDAIQIGTAIYGNTDYFLTNDKQLKQIKDIPILILEDFT